MNMALKRTTLRGTGPSSMKRTILTPTTSSECSSETLMEGRELTSFIDIINKEDTNNSKMEGDKFPKTQAWLCLHNLPLCYSY
jgi:hypothetical protein